MNTERTQKIMKNTSCLPTSKYLALSAREFPLLILRGAGARTPTARLARKMEEKENKKRENPNRRALTMTSKTIRRRTRVGRKTSEEEITIPALSFQCVLILDLEQLKDFILCPGFVVHS